MIMPGQEIAFLDSFIAETSIVPRVIDRLISDLRQAGYAQGDIDEIVLSMDESITNAVQETINKNRSRSDMGDTRDITIRYTISREAFDATIIDHGKGMDLVNLINTLPDNESRNYHELISICASESEKNRIKIRLNGTEIPLHGIGAGLKIILNFNGRRNHRSDRQGKNSLHLGFREYRRDHSEHEKKKKIYLMERREP
jgi:anti-sigma regulatory factor (Ser/Thr protein kinase)